MILGYHTLYPPDAVERALPDVASARRLLESKRPDLIARLSAISRRIDTGPVGERTLDATLMGTARLGMRHGSFGTDRHDYHCEDHVLEIADRRLGRVMDELGATLPGPDAQALMLFAACHDLRQREPLDVPGPVGGNEAASLAESFRILDVCGFDRVGERAQYVGLEIMIAASTFDPRPALPPGTDIQGTELATVAGGSLARGLGLWLDVEKPEWRMDTDARRGERLGRLAADLDTANVGEPFPLLAQTALRLCREREMRAGRDLQSWESGVPCLGFLTRGQLNYFFDLHRFASREGERVFGPTKAANAQKVRSVSAELQARFTSGPPACGQAVLDAFAELSEAA